MIQPIVDFSKQWPRAIVTFALGIFLLSIMELALSTGIRPSNIAVSIIGQEISETIYIQALFIALVSYVCGTTCLLAGDWLILLPHIRDPEKRLRDLRIGMKVFETGNAIIIERYQKIKFQTEAQAGITAAFLLGSLTVTVKEVVHVFAGIGAPREEVTGEILIFTILLMIIFAIGLYLSQKSIADLERLLQERD